jgi:translocation and assembly module TamA
LGRLLFAVTASAVACASGATQAAEPRAVVEGQLDPDLRAMIQRVIGETDRPVENRFEARRRARAAAEDAIAALRSEGYYAYVVEPEVTEADPPRPVVQITPGPRFQLAPPTVAWQGAPPDPASQGEAAATLDHAPAPGRAAEILAAEGRLVAAIQKRGYADAVAEPREVIVDHADTTVRPTYRIAAGPLVRLDGLDIARTGRTDPKWLRKLSPWTAGDTYDPDDVGELERRLLDTGVYDSVTVALAPAARTTSDGLRPIVVSLSERKPRSIEGGASYSTSEGVGVNARWTHFNRLKRADTAALFGQVSDRDSRLGVDLSLPHWQRAQQTLRTGASVYRIRTDAFDETGFGARADVTRRYGKTSYVTAGASADLSRSEEIRPGTLTTLGRDLVTVRALGDLLLDRSNDPLNPTAGWRLSARLEPTLILGDTNLPYLRAVTQGAYYLPLDKRAATVVAGRLRVGRIINGTVDQIPGSQRFYAGGGGSVRGFPYQGVGPRIDEDTPKGGLSLLEAALEVRRDLTPRWGVALFVDAGAVGSSGPVDVGDMAIGAGIGVRYNLGFAPIRVDVATPVSGRHGAAAFQIYVSIGQSF